MEVLFNDVNTNWGLIFEGDKDTKLFDRYLKPLKQQTQIKGIR